MRPRKLFVLILMTGFLLCLLAGPPMADRTIPDAMAYDTDRSSIVKITSVGGLTLPPSSVSPKPLLVPGNPIIHPVSNTHTAPVTSTLSITYDEAINSATVSTQTFVVHAMQTGLLTQTYGVSGGAISLTPRHSFKPGELVQVSATTGTLNLSGEGPISPTVWQFRIAATGGYAHFADTGQTFPFSDTSAVALGDVDSDGDLDALVSNMEETNEVWLNDGAGAFTNSNQSLGDIYSLSIALGDLDHDGDLDVFLGNSLGSGYPDEIWFNDGAGVFTKSNQDPISSSSGGLALGDLDGDGDLDAFIGHCMYDRANQVWLNNGIGVFTDSNQRLGNSDTCDVAVGDLDGDGDLDVFEVNGCFNEAQPNRVWLNDGRGVFIDPYPGMGNAQSMAVELGDVDGDGDLDAFIANLDKSTPNQGSSNEIWINDGMGLFADSGQRLGNADSLNIQLGDLDGDGDLDAFVANANLYGGQGEPNRIWLNNGNGIFSATTQLLGLSTSTAVALGDLDGDGDLDAFVGNTDPDGHFTDGGDSNRVWLNTQSVLYDLVIDKSVSRTSVRPGETLTYTLTFSNAGPVLATGVVISDMLPSSLTGLSITRSGAAITPAAGVTYAWEVQDLAMNQGGIITITGQLGDGSPVEGILTNTAVITGSGLETDTTNNSSSAVVFYQAEAVYLPLILK